MRILIRHRRGTRRPRTNEPTAARTQDRRQVVLWLSPMTASSAVTPETKCEIIGYEIARQKSCRKVLQCCKRPVTIRWLRSGIFIGPFTGDYSMLWGKKKKEEPFNVPIDTPFGASAKVPERSVADELRELARLTTPDGHPNMNVFNETIRNLSGVQWNLKVHGYLLAKSLWDPDAATEAAKRASQFPAIWKATESKDFEQSWFHAVCRDLKIKPILHRKVWEYAYVISTLREFGKLHPGARGLVFACGEEPLPSYFASLGVDVVATDLAPELAEAAGWQATAQHASSIGLLHKPDLVERSVFDQRVSLEYVNMNAIPDSLEGQFDFCWSICAFEHLGSIELGLHFVENSMKVLKPGGIVVHTTEFNFSSNDETVDDWMTVLYRQRDFDELRRRLTESGISLPDVSYSVGDRPVDWFVDLPPYAGDKGFLIPNLPQEPHLKLMVDGFPSTCFGLFVQKPA